MRLVAVMATALVIFLGIGIYSEIWLSNTAQEISLEVAYLEDTIRDRDWDKAAKLIDDIHKKWSGIADRWDIIVDHREMDEIYLALVRATRFIEAENFDFALAEVAVIHHMLIHIAKSESLRLLNIF